MHWIICIPKVSSIGQCNNSDRRACVNFCSRDLKPENLLLGDDFRIKITDFGTGKLLGPGGMLDLVILYIKLIRFQVETAKTFVGTSQYVSPELLEASETSRRSVIVFT